MPIFDGKAYKRYPQHNFVYDKLWIAKSQGLKGGKLENLRGKEKTMTYPIFIKPRWGHLSASSKNCFKISLLSAPKGTLNLLGNEALPLKRNGLAAAGIRP